eukprot:Plantae.Rhodophyta-Purpureofilum_apyrenoidigerum.ctg15585.p1 GENE.Plantae.Rhodophyta-Purpureofilum_apyrenoidigerum.ctg15585~~Plantae.Rhodophyta-Purpureofilum_apyrenoidigerum.ctg15585.p1  ORF type:complete len:231 (+),score=9.83 Plantae.Rhodophyta-Purpureofilum_apyrenoidigerum.ctg15585:492-1184(+)
MGFGYMRAVFTGILLLIITPFASGIPITRSDSLNPGDSYRLAFVTSGRRDARPTNIDDYNIFVTNTAQSVSELAALDTDWWVIGSSASVSARENTQTRAADESVPIYLLSGERLVDGYSDLWDGSLDVALNINELGEVSNQRVWTGSNSSGERVQDHFGQNSNVVHGFSGSPDGNWVSSSFESRHRHYALYAMSGVITVDSPSSAIVFALALLTIALRVRKSDAWKPVPK